MAIDAATVQSIFDQLREVDHRSIRVEAQNASLLRMVESIEKKLDERERPCQDFLGHLAAHEEGAKSRRVLFHTVLGGTLLSLIGLLAAGLHFALKAGWLK